MSLDYKETLAYAEFWRTDILPNLQHLTDGGCSFNEYLQGIYKKPSAFKTFAMPLPYVYSLKFIKRFKEKCVTFVYNSPDEINKGASSISAIYQFNMTLHGLANIHFWRDEGENDGHITLFLVYHDIQGITDFVKENVDLVKEPKVVPLGFGTRV